MLKLFHMLCMAATHESLCWIILITRVCDPLRSKGTQTRVCHHTVVLWELQGTSKQNILQVKCHYISLEMIPVRKTCSFNAMFHWVSLTRGCCLLHQQHKSLHICHNIRRGSACLHSFYTNENTWETLPIKEQCVSLSIVPAAYLRHVHARLTQVHSSESYGQTQQENPKRTGGG